MNIFILQALCEKIGCETWEITQKAEELEEEEARREAEADALQERRREARRRRRSRG